MVLTVYAQPIKILGTKCMFKVFWKIPAYYLAVYAVTLLAGCTSINDPISTVKLDTETCSKLMIKGVDCMNRNLPERHLLAHVAYHQQLLPIHQRDDILSVELASASNKK
jgi:hypothetical protein